MSVILENAPEEEENDLFDGRGTVIQNNTGEEFDLTANIMNNFINMHHQKFINEEINYNNIISFPNFQLIKEKDDKENNYIEKDLDDKINHKMQYYLFITTIIEDIIKNKEKLDDLINIIKKQKNKKISINSLLLKLYRLAFKFSGTKHRDFPYFSYYEFLSKLNFNQFKLLKEDFDDLTQSEVDIFEIYGNVNLEKEKEFQRKEKKKKLANK